MSKEEKKPEEKAIVDPFGEFKLRDGRVITFGDFYDLTQKEWREFLGPGGSAKDEDELIARLTSLEFEEIENLLRLDWQRLVRELILRVNNPLTDPN